MLRIATAIALAILAGCAAPTTLIARPPEGLRALRFLETVRLPGALGNTWEFPANTMMVQDRVREADAVALWCGTMIIRDIVAENRQTCFTLNGGTVGILADIHPVGFIRELPEGSVEMTRLR